MKADEIKLKVSPLDIRHLGSAATLASLSLTQEQIDAAYERQRREVRGNDRVRWGDPRP